MLPREFYERDVVAVARDLIGCEIRHGAVRLRITEVEAYGPEDTASHARFGATDRTRPMFGEGGRLYVYLCYGIHHMVNVVTSPLVTAAAVLLRSCEPIAGHATIRRRRGGRDGADALAGPGTLGSALGIGLSMTGHALFEVGGVTLHEGTPPERLLAGPRVGIDYASAADKRRAWRFAMPDCTFVTHPATLRTTRREKSR